MAKFDNVIDTKYNSKKYSIIKVLYKNIYIPIILDKDIYERIKSSNKNWSISKNGTVYTIINKNILYLHELVFYIKNNRKNTKPLIHLNKIGLDNRTDNIIEDVLNKEIRKNLNKKARTVTLKTLDASLLPSFVWYLKPDKTHGERFQVDLGNIKWKCTSSDGLSLNYKLEETKKYLRQYKNSNPIEFRENSMNSDLNDAGIKLKKQFYDILKLVDMNFEYTLNSNTDNLLKEDTSKLTETEKKLLSEFSIYSHTTTYDRLKLIQK